MLGQRIFISYRGMYYQQARAAGQALLHHGQCRGVTLVPPNTICSANELLYVFEYFELGEMISDHMAECDAFVYIKSDNYLASYFTQLELHQWRYHWNRGGNPVVHGLIPQADGSWNIESVELNPLPKRSKQLWANIVVGVSRRVQRQRFSTPFSSGGRYVRKYFLIPCKLCGQHTLLRKKYSKDLISGTLQLTCPFGCGNNTFNFTRANYWGNFKRKPIILSQNYDNPVRTIEVDEYIDLMFEKGQPPNIQVIN